MRRFMPDRTLLFAPHSLATALLAASILGGCVTPRAQTTALTPRDFAGSSGPAPRAERTPLPSEGPSERTGPLAAQQGLFDVSTTVGSPTISPEAPAAGELPVLIDGTVGNINNKAVYISDFLAPISAELQAKANELKRPEWMAYTRKLIRENLNQQIEDELLRAEALASFSPEQRQGFRAFIDSLKQKKISENYGSPEMATEALRNREGQSLNDFGEVGTGAISLEEWSKQEEVRTLIAYQLQRQIFGRVNISWREILLAYEKARDTYNPPPAVYFRMIRVSNDRPDDIKAVQSALTNGIEFSDLAASSLNDYEPEKDGMWPKMSIKESFEKEKFFEVAALNDAAHTLSPRAWTGPIKLSSSTVWLMLDHIEIFSMPIYLAQLSLEGELKARQAFDQRQRYIDRLKRRASYTDVDEMTDRLLEIAAERFYPESTARVPAAIPPK